MDDRSSGASSRNTGLSDSLTERLRNEPWLFGFLSLMRRVGANKRIDPIGTAERPGAEPFRLGQRPSLTFSPREIADVDERNGRLHVHLYGLGVLGPNGPLPIHMTEIAREREESRHDATLSRFLDLFHHRYLGVLYRAWASGQAAAGLDRADDESFSSHAASLTGQHPDEIAQRALPAHAQLAGSPGVTREARDPDGLCMTLEHYFGVPVSIDEYVFHWVSVPREEQTHLGEPGAASILGDGAMLGEQAPDRQHRFRLIIGPVDLEQYLRFTPRGAALPELVDWVRAFVGREFQWELELRIRADCASPAVIGGQQQLGWSGWLGQSPDGKPITGMRFDPEEYIRRGDLRSVPGADRADSLRGPT
ncbi:MULTISPECIES: type VI secretion system baseplate subunit TssG [unclassified Caballeronia]|uniref:type VI secretion system baseplate subunit TssG n=1 Tax=unclassified Caballeronia TaxID=2646786 RepID=UPI002854C26F|nr:MULTISPECIES: type VI secretion system baseplate subunit TssG [unclassified Caballeronia]MDR5741427.1 type VI secretion system baseplate subunit TssG [Caballeronia sp. LZ016]MDR5806740.1 type VI secretion system baseplate subunit TssG [Caballeronia sp. LZ019]